MVGMTLESWMMNGCHFRMLSKEVNHLQRILYMALHTQAQRLYALQEDEGIEGRDGSTSITQDDGTDASDVCGCTYCVGKHDAMIRGIGL